jgi:DNA primase
MASVKKETNLARCFVCHRNINTIEIVIYYKKWNFVDSVKYLKKYYNASLKESSHLSIKKFEGMKTNRESGNGPQSIGDILKNCLQQNSDYVNSSNILKYKKLE